MICLRTTLNWASSTQCFVASMPGSHNDLQTAKNMLQTARLKGAVELINLCWPFYCKPQLVKERTSRPKGVRPGIAGPCRLRLGRTKQTPTSTAVLALTTPQDSTACLASPQSRWFHKTPPQQKGKNDGCDARRPRNREALMDRLHEVCGIILAVTHLLLAAADKPEQATGERTVDIAHSSIRRDAGPFWNIAPPPRGCAPRSATFGHPATRTNPTTRTLRVGGRQFRYFCFFFFCLLFFIVVSTSALAGMRRAKNGQSHTFNARFQNPPVHLVRRRDERSDHFWRQNFRWEGRFGVEAWQMVGLPLAATPNWPTYPLQMPNAGNPWHPIHSRLDPKFSVSLARGGVPARLRNSYDSLERPSCLETACQSRHPSLPLCWSSAAVAGWRPLTHIVAKAAAAFPNHG